MAMLISPSAVWIGFCRVPLREPGRRRCPLVASAAKEGGDFFLDRPLQHQAGSQPTQRGQMRAILTKPAGQQLVDLLP